MTIKFDLESFNPALRGSIKQTMDSLLAKYPTAGIELELSCDASFKLPDGTVEAMEVGTFASTGVSTKDESKVLINMNPEFFGLGNGALEKFNETIKVDLERGFHGSMPVHGVVYILVHEFGHVIDRVINYHFYNIGGEDGVTFTPKNEVGKKLLAKWQELITIMANDVEKRPMEYVFLKLLSMAPPDSPLPTPYAFENSSELFAECFAALHCGSETERNKPTTKLVKEYIDIAYEAISKGEMT